MGDHYREYEALSMAHQERQKKDPNCVEVGRGNEIKKDKLKTRPHNKKSSASGKKAPEGKPASENAAQGAKILRQRAREGERCKGG